jgi:hypothetical protein
MVSLEKALSAEALDGELKVLLASVPADCFDGDLLTRQGGDWAEHLLRLLLSGTGWPAMRRSALRRRWYASTPGSNASTCPCTAYLKRT